MANPALSTARGLGWFSLAMGLAQIAAPRQIGRTLGMEKDSEMIRACGFREVATGVGILTQQDPRQWMWGRVGGDMLDIAALGMGLKKDNPKRHNVAWALGAVALVTALDLSSARGLGSQAKRMRQRVPDYSSRSGLPRPPDQMRGAARDFKLPRDMQTPPAMRYPAPN
ncbi:cyclase dehydrase [Telmatospirillum sp. J64-1]|uniref:cyclase dehydrase n=1 Tax=Telmatospirillum sp. J64-1 TaxID=2502183 RepID=UPI00115CB522|nr:cyclase dehydrase [Telmatospirillum sp. J64-1]